MLLLVLAQRQLLFIHLSQSRPSRLESACSETNTRTQPLRFTTLPFFFRDRRRRDPDNLSAMLKPVWDGLQDAGVLGDDRAVTLHPIEQHVDPDGPGLRLEVWPS